MLFFALNIFAEMIFVIFFRQVMTSKDDLARLLHLRIDPIATADWTSALREKSRAQLDVVICSPQ
jgi:hypothetical protein